MTNSLASVAKIAVDLLNRFSGWLLFFAIIWLCWNVSRVLWLVIAPPQAPNLPILELQVQQKQPISTNAALAIFENPEVKNNQQAAVPPPQAKLAGVMLAEPNEMSSALIEVNGVVENYRIGEVLQGSNYKLIDVSWNQAIIADPSDNQVIVDMPERMALNQEGMSASNNKGKIGNRRLPTLENKNQTRLTPRADEERTLESAVMPAEEALNETSTASAIDTAVEELKQNPASYLSSLGVMASGDGYQVTDAMPSELRNRIGLETGDKVMSVNGQSVGNDPASDADLLTQVKGSGEAVIEVQRGEQVITIRQQF